MSAPKVSKSALLDASPQGWSAVGGVTLAGRDAVVRSPEYYNGQLAAVVIYARDDNALYALFDVTDPVFMQPFTGADVWKADCVQLGFNLDPDKASISTGNDFADQQSRRYTLINVALTPRGVEAFRAMTYDRDKLPTGTLSASQLQLVIVQTATGLKYELTIPWSTLGASSAPQSGDRIGIAATVNDMNRNDQSDPTALGLFCADWPKDPATFGQIVLTEK